MKDTNQKIISNRRLCSSLAVLCLLVFACREEPPPPPEALPRTVKYLEVRSVAGGRERTFTGFSKADVRSQFSFRVGGTLEKIHVEQGDFVPEGTLIAEIDPTDFEIEVREIEASLAEARAQLVLADSEFQRIQGLYERDSATRGEFDSALAKRASGRAGVDSVLQKLEKAKRQVGYARLSAPIQCGIVDVKVEEGEAIQAGAAVVEVVSGENPQVEIAVPENVIAQVRKSARAQVAFSAVPNRLFQGRVTLIGVVPSEGLTTYPVTIALNESWEQLAGVRNAPPIRPGMAVEARLRFGSGDRTPRHLIPAHAVLEDGEGRFVFVVRPQQEGRGVVERRPVETGQLVTSGLEVFTGLADGERVVIAGLNQIQEGQEVRILAGN